MTPDDRALCTATGSLLRGHGAVAALGLALTGIGLGVLALTGRSLSLVACMGFGAVVLIGVLERYLWLRLKLDVGLFEALASGAIESLQRLDGALQRLSVRDAAEAPRNLDARVAGTRQLMQRHGVVVACQCAMFLLALLTQDMR
ncbi:hypothetical protein [Variovorax sp. PAMC 28711]|uniref:hypothetical protein n=1 Tax=Variovorax sp. PAMC 28711 TaxID=1795631 RepID=UPI00078CD10A|nr:hypothetical protein [Variovorax sp. PAMC 28711]AMM25268.1 hypothetical protein AX767_13545 [Variovorax sp. PAMC 28711]